MKRLKPGLLPLLFALALVIPAAAAPPVAARPQAAVLPAMPRLSALPGLPPAAAPREGQGETEREFYGLLRDFEAYRTASPGFLEQGEAEQRRRELYDRGIGILTGEGALLDSSPASLEQFALEMDALYSPGGHFTLEEQLRGYATLYAWRAFTEATRLELAREIAIRNRPASTGRGLEAVTWRGLLEDATGFERRYSETLYRRGRREAGSHPPSRWQLDAYAAVREPAYQAAASLLELDLASGRLSWSEMEELAYGFDAEWENAAGGSVREEFFATAEFAAFDAAFFAFERKLVIGGLGEQELAALERRADLMRTRDETPIGSIYASRIYRRIQRYRASGR